MNRLTNSNLISASYSPWELCGLDKDCLKSCEKCNIVEMYKKLAAYEDIGLEPEELQELAEYKRNNRIYLLPCAIGSKVYMIIQRMNDLTGYAYPVIIQSSFRLNMIEDLNKSIFLTREEADAALEKIRMEKSV